MKLKDSWMFRTLFPWASPLVADPGDDEVHEAYDSYAIRDELSASAGTTCSKVSASPHYYADRKHARPPWQSGG